MLCLLLSLLPTTDTTPPYALDSPHEHPAGWICRMLQWEDHRPIDDTGSSPYP